MTNESSTCCVFVLLFFVGRYTVYVSILLCAPVRVRGFFVFWQFFWQFEVGVRLSERIIVLHVEGILFGLPDGVSEDEEA